MCTATEVFPRCAPLRDSSTLASSPGLSLTVCVLSGAVFPGSSDDSRLDPARFLGVSECMAMMGAAGYDFHGLTSTQSSELIGKAMCSTALVKVLLPVLRHLGQFEST